MRSVALVLSVLLLPLASAAAAPRPDPRAAGSRIAALSGDHYDTYDLGADPGAPGAHRYAVAIHAGPAPEVSLPDSLAQGPAVIRFFARGECRWRFDEGALAVEPGAAAPVAGVGFVREDGVSRLRFPAGYPRVRGAITCDEGITIVPEAPAFPSPGVFRFIGRDGAPLARLCIEGATVEFTPAADGGALVATAGRGADFVEANITPFGTWGGYQNYWRSSVFGTSYSQANGNPYATITVGEGSHGIGVLNNHYNGYVLWDLAGALPANAVATGVWLWPLNAASFAGAAQTITVYDVDNGRPLATAWGATGDAAVFNDFGTMRAGATQANYIAFSAAAAGNFYYQLNRVALEDLHDRLRGPGWFAVGLDGNGAVGSTVNFSSGASQLWIYYTLYAPDDVRLNRLDFVGGSNAYDSAVLYNWGEATGVAGWQLQSVNSVGTVQTFTLPAGTTIARRGALRIHDTTGSNTATDVYTQGDVFTWADNVFPYGLQVRLWRTGGTSAADYVCLGGAGASPPAGTAWVGGCAAQAPAPGVSYNRIRDPDTDSVSDWAAGTPGLPFNPGQNGTRRVSEIFFNHVGIYPGDNWLSLVNYGPSRDVSGWKVKIYSSQSTYGTLDGTYVFPAGSVLATGDILWFKEQNNWGGAPPAYGRNLGFAVNWANAPMSGLAVLTDGADNGAHAVIFGDPRHLEGQLPANLPWTGPYLSAGTGTHDLILDTDLVSQSAAGWIEQAGYNNWPGLGPNARGATRHQTSFGARSSTASRTLTTASPAAAFGTGDSFQITALTAVEEFALAGAPAAPGVEAQLVVKKRSTGPIFTNTIAFSRTLTLTQPGMQMVRSGRISPPVILQPGEYAAFMLYMNNGWQAEQDWGVGADPSVFGSGGRPVTESAYPPTTSYCPTCFCFNCGPVQGAVVGVPVTPLSINAPAPDAVAGSAYSFSYGSTGGYGATRTWSVVSGSLPPGFSLSAAGALTGNPDWAYSPPAYFGFRVRVTDEAGLYAELDETFGILGPLTITKGEFAPYDGRSVPYSDYLTGWGGLTPYTWSCTFPGAFAGALSCASDGTVGGTLGGGVPNGTYSVSVSLTDARNVTVSKSLPLRVYVAPAILTAALPDGFIAYTYGPVTLQAKGGSGAPTWSVSSGALPPGLALAAATGVISGTPTATGTYPFTIGYSTPGGSTSRAFTVAVAETVPPPYWVRRGLAGGAFAKVVFSPSFAADGFALAISGDRRILYLSRDGGIFWQRAKLLLPDVHASSGTLVDTLDSAEFAPNFDGRPPGTPGRPAGASQTLAVATALHGVMVSQDADATWFAANLGLTAEADGTLGAASIHFHPNWAANGTLYVASRMPSATLDRLYSGSLGGGWAMLANGGLGSLTTLGPVVMSPTFAADQTFFATGTRGEGLIRSTDGGASWRQVVSYYPAGIFAIELSPNYATDQTLLILRGVDFLNDHEALISHDGGASFVVIGSAEMVKITHFPPDYNRATNPVIFGSACVPNCGSWTGNRLMRSGDDGASFSPTGDGGMPSSKMSWQFAISPAFASDRTVVALGQNGPALFRSLNAGGLWGPSDNGLYRQEITAAAFAPDYQSSGRAFAGSADGIYRSPDRGKTWAKATVGGLGGQYTVRSLRPSPNYAVDQTVFASACGAGSCTTLKSTDGGLSFSTQAILAETWRGDSLRVSPNFAADSRLYAVSFDAGNNGDVVQRSADGGASFSPVGAAYFTHAGGISVSPGFASDQTLCANDVGAAYAPRCTYDGGTSFTTLAGPVNGYYPPVFSSDFNRAAPLSGTNHTLFWNCRKSADSGASWSAAIPNCSREFVSSTYASDQTVWFEDYGVGLRRSTDGGASSVAVVPAQDPAAFRLLTDLVFAPAFSANQTLMVATGGGLFISRDGGATFELSTGTESFSSQVTAVAQDPNRRGRLYLGSTDNGAVMSSDDGLSATDISAGLVQVSGRWPRINDLLALDGGAGVTVLIATSENGIYRRTFDAAGNPTGAWTRPDTAATVRLLYESTSGIAYVHATRLGSGNCMRRSQDLGASWTLQCANLDSQGIGLSLLTGPTSFAGGAGGIGPAPRAATGTGASFWATQVTGGARYSLDGGSSWIPAAGGNDYALPTFAGAASWTAIQPLGLVAGQREVVIGNNADASIPAAQRGVWLSRNGGDTWRNVAGAGSGLESTSKVVSAFLTATTPYGTTDVLVGVNGASNGGVYLSGDGGEHWTQINQGFDPANLSISSLVKTSCAGCPVQYYSGTYGSGVYTRTITVNAPPTFPNPGKHCFAGACATGATANCDNAVNSGPEQGGQAFKLCGGGFLAGAVVEFDGVAAGGCVTQNTAVITCTATPPHAPGAAIVRVRNPDTRAGTLPAGYVYLAGAPRAGNTLRAAKAAGDAWISWTCAGCTAGAPARLYRGQNAALTLYPENYNGGANGTQTGGCTPAGGNSSCHNQSGANATAQSYFWTVE